LSIFVVFNRPSIGAKNMSFDKPGLAEWPPSEGAVEYTISRAFLAAYLLTASIQQAEGAVLGAIDSFDPDRDSKETLFRHAVHAAVERPMQRLLPSVSCRSGSNGWRLPIELQAVLDLADAFRRCFVLRALAGFSREACGRLLGVRASTVDRLTSSALKRLAGSTSKRGAAKR
jgi:DNA-directed RNA polymerase specialized sigma24 family protein